MTKEDILTQINNDILYQFDAEEQGFEILTRTRYTNKVTDAVYVCDFDGTKVFKINIKEVEIKDLPKEELKVFNEHLEIINEE